MSKTASKKSVEQLVLPSKERPWENFTDEQLLAVRVCDLKVRIEGSMIAPRVDQLYRELEAKDLTFSPPCYLTTEWLTPDRIPAVGIPFYLAHPRLIKLERAMMVEAEGEAEKDCMQLLRHETGHAINYAYQLYRRSRWRELFGNMSEPYDPHQYVMRPYSKQYVVHLRGNYAQAHPDEDFAETFAVWLTPHKDWRKKYKDWGALKKLEYVDHIMKSIAATPPKVKGGPRHFSASRTRSTLRNYYRKKQQVFGEGYLGFYDPLLLKLFSTDADITHEKAYTFINAHRTTLIDQIANWSRLPKYSIRQLVIRLSQRAREMKLYLAHDTTTTLLSLGISLTAELTAVQTDDRSSEESFE